MFCFKSNSTIKSTIKKSKFYCFGFNVKTAEEAKQQIKQLHTQYPDASHICYAYILGNDQKEFFYSDDGEPSKTAGLPIYGAMVRCQLSFCLIAIVRYFGGTKFGTTLLKDTFSSLANELIGSSSLSNVQKVKIYKISVPYSSIKNIENNFKDTIVKKEFDDSANFYIYQTDENKLKLSANNAVIFDENYLLIKD